MLAHCHPHHDVCLFLKQRNQKSETQDAEVERGMVVLLMEEN